MSDVRPSDSLQNAPEVPVGPTSDPLAQALAITAEIYSAGPFEVEEGFDPEHPETRWREIVVPVTGTVREIVDRKTIWHRRMISELGAAGRDITIRVVPTE